MKKWEAHEWVMVILALSVSLSIFLPFAIRVTTAYALSDNSTSVLNNFTQSIGVGLLSIVATRFGRRKDAPKE